MKYMIKSKMLATFCAACLLTLSTTAQPSSWFNDKDLTLTGVYYYPEHWDENQWERDFKKITESKFRFRIIVKLYGRLVIELPSDNTRIVTIVLRQFFNHLIR